MCKTTHYVLHVPPTVYAAPSNAYAQENEAHIVFFQAQDPVSADLGFGSGLYIMHGYLSKHWPCHWKIVCSLVVGMMTQPLDDL